MLNNAVDFAQDARRRMWKDLKRTRRYARLVWKSRQSQMTNFERKFFILKTYDLLKTIPILIIIALPFTFLTLPVMIKLLPNKFLPVALQY